MTTNYPKNDVEAAADRKIKRYRKASVAAEWAAHHSYMNSGRNQYAVGYWLAVREEIAKRSRITNKI